MEANFAKGRALWSGLCRSEVQTFYWGRRSAKARLRLSIISDVGLRGRPELWLGIFALG